MADLVRVAIVGTGYIADYHARAVKNTEGADLAGALGIKIEDAEEFCLRHGGTSYATREAIAADPEVDAVVIATPNNLHLPLGKYFLETHKHLLIEKPMAMNAGEAARLRKTARRLGMKLMVGHMWRFDREALYLKEQLDSGAIGEIVKTKGYGIHANWGPAGWFTRRIEAGGGALIDMGVHAIDTVRFLLGDPAPAAVYAQLSTRFGDYDVDDLGVIVITWVGGAVSVIESGWWNPHMDGPEASTQLFGTKGYASLFPTQLTRIEDHEPQPTESLAFPERKEHCDQHIYDGQMAELVAAVVEDRDPIPGDEHGIAVMRICDAAYLSAKEGRVIAL